MHKTYGFLALLTFGFGSLACPTRPIDKSDGPGGHAGSDEGDGSAGTGAGGKGAAGAALGAAAGNGGVAGKAVGGAGDSETGGSAGAGPAGSAGAGGAGQGGAGGKGAAGADAVTGAAGTGGIGGHGGAAGAGTGGVGGCAPACGSTQTCVGSTCLLTDGQQCTLPAQCASGTCTPFYQDADGDGYGTGVAVGFCGTSTPVGYASQTGDCCDTAPNLALAKLIHPNAGFQTTSAGGVCGVTWDYNCDGTVETSLSAGECDTNATYPTCARVILNFPQSDCGTVENDYTCIPETVPLGTGPGTMNVCAGSSGGPETLGCK